MPIALPTCRNFSPSLSVNYSSGGGNGVFTILF
ncbi:MAG: SpvB/TcaC N-terminal domain-containing protein [Wolbachia sp.]